MKFNKFISDMRSPVAVLAYKLSVVLFLYTICRILFYTFNTRMFPGVNFGYFTVMMLGGLRFDISAILYINLLYILFQLVPFKFRHSNGYQKPLNYLFYVTNAVGLALNCIDFIYYRFTQRRTTVIVFSEFVNEQNYLQLAKHFFLDYYYILLIWILLIAILVWLSKKVNVAAPNWSGLKYYGFYFAMMVLLSGLIVTGLRSGLPPKQDFPLVPSDAAQYTIKPNDVAIVQNTPFCMIRTSRKPVYKKQNYFSPEELKTIYSPLHYPDTTKEFKKMNVVVVIVESLGKETLGCYNPGLDNGTYKGYTPFLDSLANFSQVFMNSFCNTRWSIDATPSVIAGIPSLQEAFTQCFYSNNAINTLSTCLTKKGYSTAFAHGAPNGSLGLTGFVVQAGINKYIGKDEYANDADFDGVWGIWDHKFLPFFARECGKLQEPFLASVFTVSSHHPYKIPSELTGRFAEGPLPIFKSIRYIDYALGQFFKEASGQPWFRNTIFVITGDHTCARYHDVYLTSLGAYGVPLIFYTPGGQLEARKDFGVAQQIDIMPTILDFLGYDKPYFAFGKDLLDPKQDKIAVTYIGNTFQMIWDEWVIQHDTYETVAIYNRESDPLLMKNLVGKNDSIQLRLERKVKAFIQEHNNRMVDNKLLPE